MSSIPRAALKTRASNPGAIGDAEFEAQRGGARDHFLAVVKIGGRDPVDHLSGRIAQHPLGADVEDLDDALRVGGDARKVGTVENGALQRARLEQRLFRLLARGVVGADQQVADDGVLRIAERRNGHDRREAAAILAEVGQFVDVLDPARRLEHQRFESRRDRRAEFDAQAPSARAITSCGSEMSAGVILFITSAAV